MRKYFILLWVFEIRINLALVSKLHWSCVGAVLTHQLVIYCNLLLGFKCFLGHWCKSSNTPYLHFSWFPNRCPVGDFDSFCCQPRCDTFPHHSLEWFLWALEDESDKIPRNVFSWGPFQNLSRVTPLLDMVLNSVALGCYLCGGRD